MIDVCKVKLKNSQLITGTHKFGGIKYPIEIELTETPEGEVVVSVKGNVTVKVNDKVVTIAESKIGYKNIPSQFTQFIKKNKGEVHEFDERTEVDFYRGTKEITAYFPTIIEDGTITFRYDTSANNLKDVLNDYDIEEKDSKFLINSQKRMKKKLKDLGLELNYSHSQDMFIWWWADIKFDIESFTEEAFYIVSDIIISHDKDIDKIYNKR